MGNDDWQISELLPWYMILKDRAILFEKEYPILTANICRTMGNLLYIAKYGIQLNLRFEVE